MPEIRFDKEGHKYFLGDRELISVTALLQEMKISPDYSMVDEEVLKAKADKGTLIHKEIEEYLKEGKVGFTKELQSFIKWREESGATDFKSEFMLNNDLIAGTCDLMFKCDGFNYIADIKTTSTLHKNSVSWQLSLYNYLNGGLADFAQAFHFVDGELMIVSVPLKPKEEIEELLKCYQEKRDYKPLTIIPNEALATIQEAEAIIAKCKRDMEEAEARKKEVTEAIMGVMEERGILTYETDNIKLTYVAPMVKKVIDTAKFKKDHPELAEAYTKTQNCKAQLRIKLKGE